MLRLIKLRIKSLYNDIKTSVFLVIFPVVTLIFLVDSFTLTKLFLFLFCLISIFFKSKKLFFITLVLVSIIFANLLVRKIVYKCDAKTFDTEFIIIDKKEAGKKFRYTVKKSGKKYYLYDSKNFNLGTKIYLSGKKAKVFKEHLKDTFSYESYLRHASIYGIIKTDTINVTGHKFVTRQIGHTIGNYFKNNYKKNSQIIILALLIGNKELISDEDYENISQIGIGHLFVISGLHMGLIITFLTRILKMMKIKEKPQAIIITIFLILYLIITNFLISIIRVIITYVIKKGCKQINSLDVISFNILIVLLINPLYLFSYSFLLSYIISFFIIYMDLKETKSFKQQLKTNLTISLFSVIITLPIIMRINPTINLLSIFFNLFYIPIFTKFLLPLTFLTAVIKPVDIIFNFIVSIFFRLNGFFSKWTFFNINVFFASEIIIFLYYITIFLFIKRKKVILSIIILIFMLVVNNVRLVNFSDEVYFFDLKEGESSLISLHNNQFNVLIDTGIKDDNSLVSYLKVLNIKKLDLVLISHGDDDHIGGLKKIIDTFHVKLVGLSFFDDVSQEKYLALNANIDYILLKKGDQLKNKYIDMRFIHPAKKYNNINDNSNCFILSLKKLSIFFTGDITAKAEKDLIVNQSFNVDILKLAHHGSITSTSEAFLNCVKFKLAIGQNGYNNIHGFPNQQVINRLKNSYYIMTIDYGSVVLRKKFYQKEFKVVS